MTPGFLASMTFLNPWILAGLAFLPALWFLLRVTPPAPRRIKFPATRFLAGLQPDEHTTSRTPWWILLLRILTVALVIVALARPILNPADVLPGDGPVRIVIDNGWAAA
ncbi:MAG TPA: BatA domain-containing protein, partial [Alphaproteobacteria bacterium]